MPGLFLSMKTIRLYKTKFHVRLNTVAIHLDKNNTIEELSMKLPIIGEINAMTTD